MDGRFGYIGINNRQHISRGIRIQENYDSCKIFRRGGRVMIWDRFSLVWWVIDVLVLLHSYFAGKRPKYIY